MSQDEITDRASYEPCFYPILARLRRVRGKPFGQNLFQNFYFRFQEGFTLGFNPAGLKNR